MERDSRIPDEIRRRMPEILASWREKRRSPVEDEAFARLEAGVGRLVEVFTDFLRSPNSVETFSKGGAVHDLVGRIARDQHDLGRDAVGVIEDFATLRRCVWRTVEGSVDLSSLDGREVAWFFKKMMQASDWVIEAGLEAYDAIIREEMDEALGRAAATDLVTGLPDRDLFNRLLLPRAVEAHERFALAVFDVADFSETVASGKVKRARRVLRRLAETVREAAPPEADCARFGDDEICVIVPGANSEGAYRIAERVLEDLAENREGFQVDVGVAEYPAHGEAPEELVVETLKALKMAKRVGGSGIVVAH
jgi:diguanylate cyclase (GGDEF)-like protein